MFRIQVPKGNEKRQYNYKHNRMGFLLFVDCVCCVVCLFKGFKQFIT